MQRLSEWRGRHRRAVLVGAVLVAYLLVFLPFLGEHWVHDAYLVAQTGYGRMPGPLFSQGRVFSALFYRILEGLAVPYLAAMTLTVFLSLVFLTAAVVVVYDSSEALRQSGSAGGAVALLGACALLINPFVTEFFLFYETAVMCLGILLAALAARAVARAGGWRGYAAALLLLTASMFCYQADVAFFPPLVLCLLAARGRPIWQATFSAAAVYGAACLSNVLFLRLFSGDARVGEADILLNLGRCFVLLGKTLWKSFQFLPPWWFLGLIVLAAATLIVTCLRAKQCTPLWTAALGGVALVVCALLPLMMLASDHWYAIPRAVAALAGLPGLLLLFLPRAGRWQAVVAAAILLVVVGAQIDYQWSNRKNSALDAAEIAQIVETVRAQEAARGAPFARIEVTRDASPVYHRPDVRDYGDATLRILSVSWMPTPMLSHALGGSPKVLTMSPETAERLFGGQNWDEIHPDQFVVEGDVLYLCLF